jgi:predicted SAM-dependent methyltransferase
MEFINIKNQKNIYLYAGSYDKLYRSKVCNIPFIGLQLEPSNEYNIQHNVLNKMDLYDNSVDIYQSEDVFEHIEYNELFNVINEIYRVLKPGGLFRFSIPDYSCDILYNRCIKNNNNEIIFDPNGGGSYDYKNSKVINGGHVWFPKYESVKSLLDKTNFEKKNINFLHYYDENNNSVTKIIDYSKGYIHRTPDFDNRVNNPYRPMSIVVDCYK